LTHSFDIVFDSLAERQANERVVSCVVLPRDRFTRKLLLNGVDARIKGVGLKARKALSGALYFEDLPDRPPFTVEVDPNRAGYLPVPDVVVLQGPPGKPAVAELDLDLSPENVIDGESTVIRGNVVQNDLEISGALIEGSVQRINGGTDEIFYTRSGLRGAFALRVGFQITPIAGAPVDIPLQSKISMNVKFNGVEKSVLNIDIADRRTVDIGRVILPM